MRARAFWLLTVLALVVAPVFIDFTPAQRSYGSPQSVIHVVSVQWKADSTPEARQKAIEGIKTMAAVIPGIKNVWLKTDRVQPREYHAAFAIEFESRAAADAYADHPAHRAWEKIYLPIRQESRSLQITN